MHFLISIGIILAIIGIVLILMLKTPLKTSDKLLLVIFSCFVIKFSLDEVSIITGNTLFSGFAGAFGISTIVTSGWYVKYLTDTDGRFGWKQLMSYTPLIVAFICIMVLFFVNGQSWSAPIYLTIEVLMGALVIYYFGFCIHMLYKHRQLIHENYSGAPGSITINWMIVIISLQIVEFLLKVVLGRVITSYSNADLNIITNEYCFIIMTFLLVILGIWQKSIPVFIPAKEEIFQSALQPDDLKRYQLKLEKFMEEHKPFLDPELTIEKLGELTRIKKLLLSQTLNKAFNKNFFTFIKEYRIRHVEVELRNKSNAERTIMDIAYMSGFNSKTGFNRAFKEVTGKTPTEYLEN
ncbi:AraC-like DNA-binding protein [Mucilaginibacter frigoritolerans]|uniref:AraC-like DNA-binding protein n=1 Tax=Mucilaginibacter frigoritolerans TaxID=652788 RepID=A0A562UBR8_9SPHI|nr:helix-turn-helix domain-containing protein [Mucilaginibacter frigoritolerans]TWJ03188.1 AraC-like DNA-binding protein [Mucilaginibacter frigoritolerans]